MDYIDLPIRILHVVAGGISLLTGIAALLLSLKPKLHRTFGKVFFAAMLVVFLTAVFLAVTGSLQFLFVIAILSFYSTYHGIRSLRFFKGASVQWFDHAAAMVLGLSGIYLSSRGVYHGLRMGLEVIIILHLVFGGFMILLAFTSLNDLAKLPRSDYRWFKSHRGNMAGALIATITAFCTTALDFLPPLVAWLGPAVVFTPLFSYFIQKTNQPRKQIVR